MTLDRSPRSEDNNDRQSGKTDYRDETDIPIGVKGSNDNDPSPPPPQSGETTGGAETALAVEEFLNAIFYELRDEDGVVCLGRKKSAGGVIHSTPGDRAPRQACELPETRVCVGGLPAHVAGSIATFVVVEGQAKGHEVVQSPPLGIAPGHGRGRSLLRRL